MVKQSGTNYDWESGLEVLHQESKSWVSEIELWQVELNFFEKYLLKNRSMFTSESDLNRIQHFDNRIKYYRHDLLHKFTKKILGYEKYLARELKTADLPDDSTYRYKHHEMASHIHPFRIEFNMFKRDFFDVMTDTILH